MTDLAQAAAVKVVGVATYLLDAVRREIDAWVHDGDITVMVVLSAIAVVLLIFVVVPGRRRY
jgi:hypothetical protein